MAGRAEHPRATSAEASRTAAGRLALLPRRQALAYGAAFLSAILLLLSIALTRPGQVAAKPPAEGDLVSFQRIVEGLRDGRDYYSVAHEEYVSANYPTRSVFNWRTPAHSLLLAATGQTGIQVLLVGLGLAAVLLFYRRVKDTVGWAAAVFVALALAVSLSTLASPKSLYFSETAAGVLIVLSVAAYSNKMRAVGILAGLAALFVRELAAPYVVVSVLIAIRHKAWKEAGAWVAGLLAYAAYYGVHAYKVTSLIGPADRAADGWLAFGGPEFVLSTAGFNGVLSVAPAWVAAILLPLGLLGLFNWCDGSRAAVTLAFYVLLFALIGNPFNGYWGLLYTPLMMSGVPLAFPAIAGIVGSGEGQDEQTEPQSNQSGPKDRAAP